MRKYDLPTYEQLKDLYEAAVAFKKAKPWNNPLVPELICVENPEDKTIGYCSIMGHGGDHFGLGVFLGDSGIHGYNELAEKGDLIPSHQILHYQNCIMCSFEDRVLLTSEDRKQIKEMGLSFRGKNAWPAFRRFEPGYVPWYINSEECVFLTHALRQVLAVIDTVEPAKLEGLLNEGKTILRYSNLKNGALEWKNKEMQLPYPELVYDPVEIDDEVLLYRIKKSGKRSSVSLQIDVCYTPYPVRESRSERGYFPRLFVIADKNNGLIVDVDVYDDMDEDANVTLNKLINLCLSNGVPKEIQVRDNKMVAILQDFCQKAGINLKKVNQLRNIDDMITEMANRAMF